MANIVAVPHIYSSVKQFFSWWYSLIVITSHWNFNKSLAINFLLNFFLFSPHKDFLTEYKLINMWKISLIPLLKRVPGRFVSLFLTRGPRRVFRHRRGRPIITWRKKGRVDRKFENRHACVTVAPKVRKKIYTVNYTGRGGSTPIFRFEFVAWLLDGPLGECPTFGPPPPLGEGVLNKNVSGWFSLWMGFRTPPPTPRERVRIWGPSLRGRPIILTIVTHASRSRWRREKFFTQ